MASRSEFTTSAAIIAYALLMIALMFAGDSTARDLRPSDHGLVFQNSPPANSSVEKMRSFFNSKSSSSDASLPKATNSSDSLPPPWWSATGTGGGGNHLGGALMVASLVCGITGVVLLVASGLLYLFKHRRKPKLNESFRCDNDNNNNTNKLQLVPVVPNT